MTAQSGPWREPVVFVTVGTDHHPFDRLLEWVDRWLASGRKSGSVSCLVQTGTSAPSRLGTSVEYLTYHEMERAVRAATAVVSHAGPGNIMLCARFGKKPVVVPRRRELGEHVDNHQVLFATRLSAEHAIHLADAEHELHALLDRTVAEDASENFHRRGADVRLAVEEFEYLVERLLVG